jgi:hypothetical protein
MIVVVAVRRHHHSMQTRGSSPCRESKDSFFLIVRLAVSYTKPKDTFFNTWSEKD